MHRTFAMAVIALALISLPAEKSLAAGPGGEPAHPWGAQRALGQFQ